MATIGQSLSAARIAAGYTVADLSTRTRIRPKVLNGIEEEDFVPCGGDFYARGHIRSICRFLGLDPEPLLAEFDQEHAGHGAPVFVPLPRHVAGSPATARIAAAAREQAEELPEEGDEPMAGPPPRRIIDDTEPDAGAARPSHFERDRNPYRTVPDPRSKKKNGPRREPVPEPRGRHRTPAHAGKGAGAERRSPRPVVTGTDAPDRGGEALRRHWPWALVAAVVLAGAVVGVRAWNGEETNPLRTALDVMRDDNGNVDSSSGAGEAEDGDRTHVDPAGEGTSDPLGAEQPSEPAEEEEPAEFTVRLTADERIWVQVTGEGGDEGAPDGSTLERVEENAEESEDLFTGFLSQGQSWEHTGQEQLRVWAGNAGAVAVSIDGEDIGALGEHGEVKEVGIEADGFGG
ncbi:helix-turn-helix domain-containing protein [Nocardiopsis kunsanensis]|nr:helix-turn-helix domain-containing protein [Nocardiopsis kunsanensis]